ARTRRRPAPQGSMLITVTAARARCLSHSGNKNRSPRHVRRGGPGRPGTPLCGARLGGGRAHRGALAEAGIPGRAGRVAGAPVVVRVAEIQVAERAAQGDGADVEAVAEAGGAALELRQRVGHLAHLAVDPAAPAVRL